MEWQSKTSSSYNHNNEHLAELAGSNYSNNNMFSVDLKLGTLEDLSVKKNSRGFLQNHMSIMESSVNSSEQGLMKRGRAARNGGARANVSCSVDGCTSDLSQCREYHRRHRVCERHSKTPVVLINGKEQRFCQQCSRFQSLEEFDEVKRSCRKRLDGHNRRRRKTQSETYYMTSTGLQSNLTGKGMLQYWGDPQLHAADSPVISQPDQKPFVSYNQQEHLTSLPDSLYWGTRGDSDKPPPFMLGNNHQTVHQQQPNHTLSAGVSRVRVRVSPDRLTQPLFHSECALSLLSRHSMQSSETCEGPIMQPMAHLHHNLSQFSCPQAPGLEDDSSVSLCSSSSNNTNAHTLGGFSENASSRIFPFSWE